MTIESKWIKDSSHNSVFVIWTMNDELWELKEGVLRHYRILSRSVSKEVDTTITEIVEMLEVLPETPVPLEALGPQKVKGWKVIQKQVQGSLEKKVVLQQQQQAPQQQQQQQQQQQAPQQQQQLPSVKEKHERLVPASEKQPSSKTTRKEKGGTVAGTGVQPQPPSVNRTARARPRQADQESLEESSSQDSLIPPMELWSNVSLSYFVPEHRFYQPSLHLLAKEELSEQPTPTFSDRKAQGNYSQQRQDARPYVRQAQQTTFDHPRNAGRRVSEIPKGRPLFV